MNVGTQALEMVGPTTWEKKNRMTKADMDGLVCFIRKSKQTVNSPHIPRPTVTSFSRCLYLFLPLMPSSRSFPVLEEEEEPRHESYHAGPMTEGDVHDRTDWRRIVCAAATQSLFKGSSGMKKTGENTFNHVKHRLVGLS